MASTRLVFGVTIDRADELGRLIPAITAHGEVITTGGAGHLNEQSLPALVRRSMAQPAPYAASSITLASSSWEKLPQQPILW